MNSPLVSVIALSYNHEQFIEKSLASVIGQTYPAIELILVDDASTDRSAAGARAYLQQHRVPFPVKSVFLEKNRGNCAAFNRGLELARGKYVIDFATDDAMLPQRIARQVACFETLPADYGVVFTEAEYVDEAGHHLWFHFRERLKHIRPIPTGDVYADVLARYFISSPTMMIRKTVLDALGGYDEQLAYEDFDFWVRSARHWKYAYLDECTTQVHRHPHSMSAQQYRLQDKQLYSTYLVCQKALALNRTAREQQSLTERVKFEIRQAVFSGNTQEAELLFALLRRLEGVRGMYKILHWGLKAKLPLRRLWEFYRTIRYSF